MDSIICATASLARQKPSHLGSSRLSPQVPNYACLAGQTLHIHLKLLMLQEAWWREKCFKWELLFSKLLAVALSQLELPFAPCALIGKLFTSLTFYHGSVCTPCWSSRLW